MTALNTALRLCHRFPVFPCAITKKPACKNGFKDATADPAKLVDLWANTCAPLIGVPTGEASGLDALDIDPKNGGDKWYDESRYALPITRINHTRSGGIHVLFRHANGVKNTASTIAPGVDTRGSGGYIIWWPSTGCEVENQSVLDEWPRWLLRVLNPPKPKAPPPLPATKHEADARASLMIQRAFDRVRNAAAGQRHYELRAAAATLGGLERFLSRGKESIQNDLVNLAMEAGGEDRSTAEKTAAWAMEKGSRSPMLQSRG